MLKCLILIMIVILNLYKLTNYKVKYKHSANHNKNLKINLLKYYKQE